MPNVSWPTMGQLYARIDADPSAVERLDDAELVRLVLADRFGAVGIGSDAQRLAVGAKVGEAASDALLALIGWTPARFEQYLRDNAGDDPGERNQ